MQRLAARLGGAAAAAAAVAVAAAAANAAAAASDGRLRRLLIDVGELEEPLEVALRLEVFDVAAAAAAAAALRLETTLRRAETSDNEQGWRRAWRRRAAERENDRRGELSPPGVGGGTSDAVESNLIQALDLSPTGGRSKVLRNDEVRAEQPWRLCTRMSHTVRTFISMLRRGESCPFIRNVPPVGGG